MACLNISEAVALAEYIPVSCKVTECLKVSKIRVQIWRLSCLTIQRSQTSGIDTSRQVSRCDLVILIVELTLKSHHLLNVSVSRCHIIKRGRGSFACSNLLTKTLR